MKKYFFLVALAVITVPVVTTSCDKEEAEDTTQMTPLPGAKPGQTTFKFAANGKDCGITDGFANQQHLLPTLVHLNTDKCNGETFRPTITLNFGEAPEPGTYTVVDSGPGAKEFTITSAQYNYTNWTGTAGTVEVVVNANDATKVDIEFKSITMNNDNSSDTINPASDVLTGFIIEI